MANRRKDMWKLLYNLVNRNETNLDDVFNFVDDILCKEPSLIRCYLANHDDNIFQDTFVLWLINKFIKCLEGYNEGSADVNHLRAKNIATQRNIITSCLANHPKIYESLVRAYMDALQQLTAKLSALELDDNHDHNDDMNVDNYDLKLKLTIFKLNDATCLQDIDPDCSFHTIEITLVEADSRILDFINVLEHALSIGHAFHPELFIASMGMVLNALKECEVHVKLACLRYCKQVVNYTAVMAKQLDMDTQLAHYISLIFHAIALMWQNVPQWMAANDGHYISNADIEEFSNVTCDWFNMLQTKQCIIQQVAQQINYDFSLNILQNITKCSRFLLSAAHKLCSKLSNAIIGLYFHKNNCYIKTNTQQTQMLIQLTKTHCTLLPILAVIYVKNDEMEENTSLIIESLFAWLKELLQQKKHTATELNELCTLLQTLKYLEHVALQQKQLNYLQQQQQHLETTTHFYTQNFCVDLKSSSSSSTNDWNALIMKYFENCPWNAVQIQSIAAYLLHVAEIRHLLKAQTKQFLFTQLEHSLNSQLTILQQSDVAADKLKRLHLQLQLIFDIQFELPSSSAAMLEKLYANIALPLFTAKNVATRHLFCDYVPQLYAAGYIKLQNLMSAVQKFENQDQYVLATILRILFCASDISGAYVYKQFSHNNEDKCVTLIACNQCQMSIPNTPTHQAAYLRNQNAIWLPWCKAITTAKRQTPKISIELYKLISTLIVQHGTLNFVLQHLELNKLDASLYLSTLSKADFVAVGINFVGLDVLLPAFAKEQEDFLRQLANVVLQRIVFMLRQPLKQQNIESQRLILKLILCCAFEGISELWLLHYFKMTFYFMLHPHSLVAQETILCATELCDKHSILPFTLWNWYKRDALSLVVKLSMHVYLSKGVRLSRSLRAFTKMLGFSCVQEFICKYHRLLTTMILPYCIKQPRCRGAIVLISKLTRKKISTLFIASFLRIYTHICLTEKPEIGNKCIELIVRCTASSIQQLMNSDVKQTVSEILIYFNRNPSFVMRSFQSLLLQKTNDYATGSQAATAAFSKFIADRFLGIITHFESCLSEPYFEKPLKEEVLYSLGQILRFVGANHVTQFRFKIIAMLSFVSSLNSPQLQHIVLKIWKIFLHTVNVQELGPSLGCITAQLQPLLQHSKDDVNALYEFVILKNASMLGSYISDLYFLECETSITPAVLQCVTRQAEMLRSTRFTFAEKLKFLHKQITNENLQVRVNGLTYLMKFLANNREKINRQLINEIVSDSLIERTVNVLIDGCQHENRNLRLASAKCLGELGAIDASYLPSNYNFEQQTELPLSILTDDFAVMALNELCRAYQFQKDTKYVDSFSLAIQETLAVCGISPKENKKRALWNSIPERMRHIMEPLLDSCYTSSRRETAFKEHPLFGSHLCKSYTDWAFIWASRLIDYVQTADTKHLLASYKASIRRDNNTMAIFFPYILLHALQECTEVQTTQIYEEFLAVFNLCASSELQSGDISVLKQDKETQRGCGAKEFHSKKYAAAYVSNSMRPLEQSKSSVQSEALLSQVRTATKLCSEQIDFLQRWLREFQRNNTPGTSGAKLDENYECIQRFLTRFDKLLISRANYNCGEYARALMYMEQYIESQPRARLIEEFSFVINIYGRLMDADSVEGAVHMRTYDLRIEQEILVNRLIDRQQDMITCYEQLLSSSDQLQPEHIRGMIDSYLRMDTPKTALLITDGLWQRLADQYTDDYFKECKSELLWRLGNYDELQELLESNGSQRNTTNWPIQCAEACLNFRKPPQQHSMEEFSSQLDVIRCNVLESMRTCSTMKQHLYAHSYDEVMKLHLLNEMEQYKEVVNKICQTLASDMINSQQCVEELQQFFEVWNSRLQIMQASVRVLEPIFGFRRNLLTESKHVMAQVLGLEHSSNSNAYALLQRLSTLIDTEVGRLWIASAQINRDAGNLQRAQLSIMKAAQYEPPTLFLEKAKLLWQKGDQMISLKLLEENLETIVIKCEEGGVRKLPSLERSLYGEAKYLQATYNAESMNICSELNLRYFEEAAQSNVDSEKSYVQMSQYMEKMYEAMPAAKQDDDNELLLNIMLNYAKSLRCGCENVYQSFPRLVSLWLDTNSRFLALAEQAKTDANLNAKLAAFQERTRKANTILSNTSNALPIAIFYTAFSQLLSRICHPSADVYNILRTIIIKLVENYPQQSLWMLLPIFKSSYTNRVKRCKLIFTDARLSKPEFTKLLNDFNMLTERLIELTNKEVQLDRTYELSEMVRQLPLLFRDSEFSEILLPFEKYMQPSFPIASSTTSAHIFKTQHSKCTPNKKTTKSAASSTVPENLFPHKQIYICGFRNEITVLRSAARPKKITIRCSDGHDYDVMVKPKDDLRKDFRLMEFNGLVKRYLHQDLQARHRRLRIRTYAAIPFNEECGLVEWIPKLNSFRGICNKIYRTRGLGIPDRQLRSFCVAVGEPTEKKRCMFVDKLLPKHPPIFHEWFRQQFSTPHTWYEARSAYVKTIAVMSMVGYILGLGDRHGENILFDECNGDAVHVDFNCLFNRGELFAYPEVVPFRLTHNMVAAMGPLGVEGSYRKCCEITLRILKHEAKTLMSVLRPFVYDLVVQSRNYTPRSTAAELTDPKATLDVRRITERLQGHVKKTRGNGIPLSIEGQVNFLIAEAISIDNLAAMYIGWSAFV